MGQASPAETGLDHLVIQVAGRLHWRRGFVSRLASVAFTSTSPVPACSHWSGACSSLMGLGLSAFIRNREGKFPRSGMACARPRACGDSSVAGTLAQEEQLFQYGGSLSTAAPELGL